MAVPAYTHDLTTIADGDEASGWIEFGGVFVQLSQAQLYLTL